MIVQRKFKDDDNSKFQWVQHDYYYQALEIIFVNCRDHYLKYLRELDITNSSEDIAELLQCRSYDHRTLQEFHDHLAAFWRKSFLISDEDDQQNLKSWLNWLNLQVNQFSNMPQIYIIISRLCMEKYEGTEETKAIRLLQTKGEALYPLSFKQCLTRISIQEVQSLSIIYC